MKKLFLILALLSFSTLCKAQTVTPAPSSCPKSPCVKLTWLEPSATSTTPGTAIMAVCVGDATSCGTSPGSPGTGPNAWLQYSVSENTSSGVGIIPNLQFGNLVQIAVNFTFSSGGAPSAWSAPFQFQVGQAPPPLVPATPTGITATQL